MKRYAEGKRGMDSLIYLAPLMARSLIGFYFVFFGLWNIYHWTPIIQVMIQKKIPLPLLTLQVGIFCQVVAGAMIMANIYVAEAALILIPFTILAVFIFHPFWKFKGESLKLNLYIFIANLTVTVGALFLLIAT